jgi:hypothetical protein
MKKAIASAVVLSLLSAGGIPAAEKNPTHETMHEMMMKEGEPKPDERIELKLPAPMKVMQKRMMRRHLDTVAEIAAMLAANDLDRAARFAKEQLGWSEKWQQECDMLAKMTGEPDILKIGMAMHFKADELAVAAKAGNRDKAIAHLSELIHNCNACHNKFRH